MRLQYKVDTCKIKLRLKYKYRAEILFFMIQGVVQLFVVQALFIKVIREKCLLIKQ